jgi:hypothetical protein
MGGIFINYRREDSAATAGRLRDHLVLALGRDQIFMDVDDIPVGIDFKAHLNSQLAECGVILVVIGSKWLRVKDKAGERRLDQPEDYVANEIAAALDRQIRVIPVLIDGARIPNARDLPNSLKPLAERQAVEVRNVSFGRDADALIARLREGVPALLDTTEPPQADNAPIVKQWVTLMETLNSYLSTEKHKGCMWLIVLVIAAALGGVGVVKFGPEMKFGGVISSGLSLQQNAGPEALKAIKMFRPQKFRGFPRFF